MNRHGHLWERIISFEALLKASEKACKGKRFRPEVAAFHFDLERVLWKLHEELASQTPISQNLLSGLSCQFP